MCGNEQLFLCDMMSLQRFLADNYPDCALTASYKGVWVEDLVDEEVFREAMECFVSSCNQDRETADGYELCCDVAGDSHEVTFYIMREDGQSMFSFVVMFVDIDLAREIFK